MQENLNLIPQQDESHQNKIHTIKWKPLLWMLLGWALSWGFGWAIGFSMTDVIRNSIEASSYNLSPDDLYSLYMAAGLFIGGLIGGAGAGTSIAWVLRKESIIKRKISYLLLVIGWSVAGGIGLLYYRLIDITIGGSLCGLIGGITMVFVLWKENILSNKISIIVIPLGWVLGLTIGRGIHSSNFGYIVEFASIWLVVGIMITLVLLPHIKAENQIRAFIWIVLGWFIGGVICYLEIRRGMNYIDSIIVDDVGGAMMGMFFVLRGFGFGILVGITITTWVLLKQKTLDFVEIFGRILFSLVSIGFILWITLWVLSELQSEIDRFAYFAIQNAIGGLISWGIMIWVLRKNAIQK